MQGILKIDWGTIADAVVMAVVVAVLAAGVALVSQPGFDVLAVDWASVGHTMLNLAVVTGVITLGKDILSTNSGSLLGITPDNVAPQQG